mgnify:CR=1 FL=1
MKLRMLTVEVLLTQTQTVPTERIKWDEIKMKGNSGGQLQQQQCNHVQLGVMFITVSRQRDDAN